MTRHTYRYLLPAMAISATACFLFFRYAYPYHLLHREQMLLFTYTAGQWADYFVHPAPLACLGGDFLTQFFRLPDVGAVIVALAMTLAGTLVYSACRKWTGSRTATAVALLAFAWESMRFCQISYPLSGTVALIGSLALFLWVDRLKGKRMFAIGSIAGIPVCYALFGYGMFVFALLAVLSALTRKRHLAGACGMAAVALTLPYMVAGTYLIMPAQAYSFPATSWYGAPDWEDERILGLNTEEYAENFDKIGELINKGNPANAVSVCYNLANAMQGKLPERLMGYYQPAALGLFMPVNENSTYLSTQLAGEVWFQLGDMTLAEHAAILSMIFSPQHKSVRMVKRLAEINLITGDEEAARKYLRILSKTLFYKQWAEDRTPGKESEKVKQWLERKRACLPAKDTLRLSSTDVAKSLHLLLEANPDNRMARDYLLCFDLLMKDLPAFLKDYERYHTGTPGRLYAEALLIHLYQKRATGEETKARGIHPAVIKDFNEYNRLHAQGQGNPAVLENKFGRTYWFYYQFAQFN